MNRKKIDFQRGAGVSPADGQIYHWRTRRPHHIFYNTLHLKTLREKDE